MLKNARIENEGRDARRAGYGSGWCPYSGLDAEDWLRGYEDEKLQQLRGLAVRKRVIAPLYPSNPVVLEKCSRVGVTAHGRLSLQAKQLALAVMELNVATPKGLKLKALARQILDGSTSDDEATWVAVAAEFIIDRWE